MEQKPRLLGESRGWESGEKTRTVTGAKQRGTRSSTADVCFTRHD